LKEKKKFQKKFLRFFSRVGFLKSSEKRKKTKKNILFKTKIVIGNFFFHLKFFKEGEKKYNKIFFMEKQNLSCSISKEKKQTHYHA